MTLNKNEDDILKQQTVDVLALQRLNVLNEEGEKVPFRNFLQEKKIIVIFIRHFGCIACRAHVDQIWNKKDELLKSNSRIIFIGNGKPHIIGHFKEIIGAQDAEIYTDPDLNTFDACGMHRGILNLANFKTVSAMRALKNKGYSQGSFKDSGSHRQMGGIVIFKSPGKVIYHFASEYLGDFDNIDEWNNS